MRDVICVLFVHLVFVINKQYFGCKMCVCVFSEHLRFMLAKQHIHFSRKFNVIVAVAAVAVFIIIIGCHCHCIAIVDG